MQDPRAHFVGAELVQRSEDRFQRTLHVGLDDQRQVLAARGLELDIICSSEPRMPEMLAAAFSRF